MDTAAEEAVVGDRAMNRLQDALKKKGLQPVWQDSSQPKPGAGGIGGAGSQRTNWGCTSQWSFEIHHSSGH